MYYNVHSTNKLGKHYLVKYALLNQNGCNYEIVFNINCL
jgi:hypothetical protein